MAGTSLLPGFRFHPTDVELVMYYLKRKVMGKKHHFEAIAEVDIYQFAPWDLKDKSCLKSKDLEWFFFCPRVKKYASGIRVKRATENGFWKTTGKERFVLYKSKTVGSVKTLVFHLGHAPKGERTDWVIHEYKIIDEQLAADGVQDNYVLCKVFKKNGPGPKNGAQYGAPFDEADWNDDDDVNDAQNLASLPHKGPPCTAALVPDNPNVLVSSGLLLTEAGPSSLAGPSTSKAHVELSEHEIVSLLASFTDEDMLISNKNMNDEVDLTGKGKSVSLPCLDGNEIFNGLDDLQHGTRVNQGGSDFSALCDIFPKPTDYIELDDFEIPLNYSAGIGGSELGQMGNIFGSYGHENMQENSLSGVTHHTSFVDWPPLMTEGSNGQGSIYSDVSQAVRQDGYYPESNVTYGLDFIYSEADNDGHFTPNMGSG